MARKGQIITLKTAIPMDYWKDYAVGDEWVVVAGGAIVVAAPVIQKHSGSHTDALSIYLEKFDDYFEMTDRKGPLPTGHISRHSFTYQWNDAIRNVQF